MRLSLFAARVRAYNPDVPKKPRQAHVTLKSRKRKVRRQQAPHAIEDRPLPSHDSGSTAETSSVVAAEPRLAAPAAGGRLAARRAQAETTRARQGQLPTFDRAYIMRELRQIGVISSVLFGLIVVLTILLR